MNYGSPYLYITLIPDAYEECVNSLWPNGNILLVIVFWKKKSINFVGLGPIDRKSAIVQIMVWRRFYTKPEWLPETMMIHFIVHIYISNFQCVYTLRPRQNGRHFADDIFKCIFLNENVWIAINISLKILPKGSINNTLALAQMMAWRRPGDKPLSETMVVRLRTHIGVTRPRWVKWLDIGSECIHSSKQQRFQMMVRGRTEAKPLTEPMIICCQLDP